MIVAVVAGIIISYIVIGICVAAYVDAYCKTRHLDWDDEILPIVSMILWPLLLFGLFCYFIAKYTIVPLYCGLRLCIERRLNP